MVKLFTVLEVWSQRKIYTASPERGGFLAWFHPLIKLVPITLRNHTMKKNNEKKSSLMWQRVFYICAINHLICHVMFSKIILMLREKVFKIIIHTNKTTLLYYNRKVDLTQGRKLAIRKFIYPVMTIFFLSFPLDKL